MLIGEHTPAGEGLSIRVALSIPATVAIGVVECLFLTRGVPKSISAVTTGLNLALRQAKG